MHTEASKPALQREDAPASGWPLGLERADWQQAVGDVLFECWFPSRRLRCSAQLCTLLELNALPSDPWAALRERVHPEDRPGLRQALEACWRSSSSYLRVTGKRARAARLVTLAGSTSARMVLKAGALLRACAIWAGKAASSAASRSAGARVSWVS